MLRTNVPADDLTADDTVRAYKSLAHVERAFRSLKTVDIRPIYHYVCPRVRAHVLVCSSDCSWFRRVAGGRRYDLRRLGVRAAAPSDDICSDWHAVVPAMSFAA